MIIQIHLERNLVLDSLDELHSVDDDHLVNYVLFDDVMMVNELQIHINHSNFTEEGLNENFKLTIYRIIQEQTNNILPTRRKQHRTV